MEQVEVPSYFLCPISLHIMRDPVTLPTGITYDRDSIERWLLAGAAGRGRTGVCPVTKQLVAADCELTPNHTLRRLIQGWCALHASDGVERAPTPKPPAERSRVAALVADAKKAPPSALLGALRELKAMVADGERNRKCVAATPGVVQFLASVIAATPSSDHAACDEALDVVCALQLSEQCLVRVVDRHDAFVDALVATLQRPNTTSRTHAALLLDAVTAAISPNRLVCLGDQLFREVVQLLRDKVSKPATKAALHVLIGASSWGRNRIKAVDAGAVPVLVEMLAGEPERRLCELVLGALDRLCGCAEGRAELVAHAAGIAVIGKKALRVSPVASDKAVRVLRSVARYAATAPVVQEMAQAGAVGKLCLVAQSEQCCERTKEKARETLRLHARVWRSSPCLAPQLLALYPTS